MKDKLSFIILSSPVTKWALYMVAAGAQYAATVDNWDASKVIALIGAFAISWKTYMSNPDIGIVKDELKKP